MIDKKTNGFTPGPWYVKPREEIKCMYGKSYTRTTILNSQDGGYSPRHVIAQIARGNGKEAANAALIAKAPDMYEELEKVASFLRNAAKWIESQHGIIVIGATMQYAAENIDKLLANARGEVQE